MFNVIFREDRNPIDMELYFGKVFVVLLSLFNIILAYTEVVELNVNGEYKSPKCNIKVTCNIQTDETYTIVNWSCYGGPSTISDISKIPGFTVSPIKYVSRNRVQQTIYIDKCYSKLKLTCEAGGSSKSVTLVSGVLSVRTIVGIIFGVLAVLSAIVSFAIYRIRKKRAAAKTNNCGTIVLNPPPGSYPTQPTINPQDLTTYPMMKGSDYPSQSAVCYPQQATTYPA